MLKSRGPITLIFPVIFFIRTGKIASMQNTSIGSSYIMCNSIDTE